MPRVIDGFGMKRDQIMQTLLENKISTRRGIMAIHREAPYRSERWERSLPLTEAVTDTGLILPLFHQMTENEQDYVTESIRALEPSV